MSRLAHDALLRPTDIVDSDLGVGLVYPLDERFHRLDLWLADQAGGVAATDQLSVLRQVAEAVAYAHGNRVVHRGLTPHAVSVRPLPGHPPAVLVGDWQSAGAAGGPAITGLSSSGVTGLMGAADSASPAASQVDAAMNLGSVDADRRLAGAFQAPEGVWKRDADRVRLDVFALGALAYFVLAGRPAAADRASLRERLNRDNGLDLAADLPQVPAPVRALVLEVTLGISGVSHALTRAVREVLLGADPPVALTERAQQALAKARDEQIATVHPGGTVITRDTGDVRWWTWAGYRANATLAATFSELTDGLQRFDDASIRLRTDLTPAMWKAATGDAAGRLCLPDVDDRALAGLKFSEALPERLATATLAARLADLDSAVTVLGEPVRFVLGHDPEH